MFNKPKTASSQLVAHCFFCKNTGKTKLDNYSKYYKNEKKY